MTDVGNLALPHTSLVAMREAMAPQVDALIAQHHMVWLGGDHSITLPLLRAYHAWLGRPLAVIHFDAHCDTWKDHFDEPSGHGTWVYEAMLQLTQDRTVNRIEFHFRGSGRHGVRKRGLLFA